MTAAPGKVLPKRVGRFAIENLIGYGSQGVVLLATDPELGRRVAIKVLRPSAIMLTDAAQLMAEARVVSNLQHPNIVTLHEVGQHQGLPFLVFEYVDGQSLANLIAKEGAIPSSTAVILMSQILSGVAIAHESGIVHRDLSPSNILLTKDRIPKVTDFGLSMQNSPRLDGSIRGTLRYLSPERLHGEVGDASSDVFALGAIFFEVLVGKPLLDGRNQAAVVNKLLRGSFNPPSDYQVGIDLLIDRVVCRALHGDRASRYANARAMKEDLDVYRIPAGKHGEGGSRSAVPASVEFLLRRMTYKKGFSVLSQRIAEVQRLTAERSQASAKQLSNVVAKDIVVTQRVLTTANSAYYGRGDVTSVSRAIVLLGLQQVRLCIISALLETHFADSSAELRDALLSSFFSGILAKEVTLITRFGYYESLFVAAMFHRLGRTLVIHYFEEEYAAITELTDSGELDDLAASNRILGVPYHELGAGVAKAWKFPDGIIDAMQPLPSGQVATPRTQAEALQRYAAFANAVARIHESIPVGRVMGERKRLLERMSSVFALSNDDMDRATAEAAELTRRYAKLMKLPESGSRFLNQLERWKKRQKQTAETSPPSRVA